MIAELKPTCLIGAVGVAPWCFDEEVVQTMVDANDDRPVIFALSNPKTQAEVTAEDCYIWSGGKAIYGSGTQFDSVVIEGTEHAPGQVNNVYIFPGMSFGAFQCAASTIPDRLFLVAAGAVANSLSEEDVALNRVISHRDRLREVNLNVATAVVMEAQRLNLAGKSMGETEEHVKAALSDAMWSPN
jgi:malate dehydrogenase (oxaloacetate-decarboxylating)(NADP+)